MLWRILIFIHTAHITRREIGQDPCVEKDATDCKFCLPLTPDQRAQIATPYYKIKKEKHEAKKPEMATPTKDTSLVDPASVSVIGVVGKQDTVKSPSSMPLEKKPKTDKPPVKSKKSAEYVYRQ